MSNRSWRRRARILTPMAARCWKRICARPARRKSRCSGRSPEPWPKGKDAFVVLDTAPTGHTLLLLDATESYHREVARKASDLPEEVLQLLPRLRDGGFTRVLVVTLPGSHTGSRGGHAASRLAPGANRTDSRGSSTRVLLKAVRMIRCSWRAGVAKFNSSAKSSRNIHKRTAIVPWVTEEPVGPERLQQFFKS